MGEQDSEEQATPGDERRIIEEVLSELGEGVELTTDLQTAKAKWTENLAAIDLLNERERPLQEHVEYFVACFDIRAQWAMSAVINEERISSFYEPYLRKYLQPELQKLAAHISANWSPEYAHREVFLAKLRGQLYARIEHWKEKSLKHFCKKGSGAESKLERDQQQSADAPASPEAVTVEASQKKPVVPPTLATNSNATAASWQTVNISFTSDARVQIRNGANTETLNYSEMGFEDGRSRKPNQAWVTLRAMAEQNGIILDGSKTGADWPKVEKRIQEIRKVLRKHFGIATDPIPFVKGTGYHACFKIGCSPSFHT